MVVLVVLVLLLIITIIHVTRMRLTSPAGLYSLCWGFFIIGTILFFPKEYPIKYSGIFLLISAIFSYVIGYGIASDKYWKIDSSRLKNEEKMIPCISWKLVITFILVSFVPVAYSIYRSGVSIYSLFDFKTLHQVSHQNAVIRYSGGENYSLFEQICNSFCSVIPFVCGYSLNFTENLKQKLICFSSVVPILLQVILTNAKLGLVTYTIIFFVGYYISYSYKYSTYIHVGGKMIIIVASISISLFCIFYFSFVLRIGASESNLKTDILNKLIEYAFGHIQSFSYWFNYNKIKFSDYRWGTSTFLAISSRLGLATKVQGIYEFIPGAATNVYTPFRALIEDYGVFGSLVIIFFKGFVSRVSYNTILYSKKRTTVVQWIFAILMFSNLMVFVSIWTYTTHIVAMFIWGIFLFNSFLVKK